MTSHGCHLVLGGDGVLGRAVSRELASRGIEFVRTTRRPLGSRDPAIHLDLAEPPGEWRLPSELAACYLLAGATSLSACRRDPEGTARINVGATLELARRLAAGGSFVVFPSTNLVFDGSVPRRGAADATCPRTEYGRQKAAVELELLRSDLAAIVRLTKVFGGDSGLARRWWEEAGAGRVLHPAAGMVFSPVPLETAARLLVQAALSRSLGITQLSAEIDVSYPELAREIASRAADRGGRIEPRNPDELGLDPEHVPLHTTLDTRRLESEFDIATPSAWRTIRDALDRWRA